MTIETKYNIGDEVWFIKDNKVQSLKITQLNVLMSLLPKTDGYGCKINQVVDYSNGKTVLAEYECFPTKEELLKSL